MTDGISNPDRTGRRCVDCDALTRNAALDRCFPCRLAAGEIVHPETGWVMVAPGVYEDPAPRFDL